MDIQVLRQEIDRIDREMVRLFCERMSVASRIADYKMEHNLPIHHPAREQEVLQKAADLAGKELAGYTEALYEKMFELSKEYQISRMHRREN